MTPILYKANETDFYHRGIGSLGELTFVEVTEEGNGDFGLVLEYPTDGRYFNSIEEFMFIKAKPNSEDEPHIFRIYEIEKDTIGMSATIYATSKTITDLQGNMVRRVVANNETPQQILTRMKSNLIYPTTYDFYSDITTKSSTEWIRRNPLNCISGEEGSLLQYWGGEIKRGNQVISLLKRRGKDNVATIRYGKNLNGLVANFSVKGMVTRILPHFTYTPEGAKEPVTIEGSFVDSQYINNYPIPFIQEVDFSSDDEVTDLASLNVKAKQYFVENTDIDKPSVIMDIQIEDLFSSSEYSEKFKKLEKILLFDTVTVYHKGFNINVTAKVNKLVFDPYREKNVSLEVGSTRHTLMDDVKKDTQYQLNEVKKELNYVSLSADGKNRINYGSATPLIANLNDLWFKPNGEFTIMYRFDGAYWQIISDSEDLDKVAKEVNAAIEQADKDRIKAEEDIEAAKQTAKEYTDAQVIAFDTKFEAETGAIRNEVTAGYNNAIADGKSYTDNKSAEFNNQLDLVKADVANSVLKANDAVTKADQAITDAGFMRIDVDATKLTAIDALTKAQTATDNVNSLTTSYDALTQTVGFKADRAQVNAISGVVDQHELKISANAQAITARLTSAQVDNLITGKGYVNQAQLTATSSQWNLALTQVSTDLSNVNVGDRNLVLASNKPVKPGTGYNFATYTLSENWSVGSEYTVVIKADFKAGKDIGVYYNGGIFVFKRIQYDAVKGVYIGTGTVTTANIGSATVLNKAYLYQFPNDSFALNVEWIKIVKGNKASADWVPAPEDMATLEQFTTIDATVKGLQTTVGNKAEQSQVTQLAGQITSVVKSVDDIEIGGRNYFTKAHTFVQNIANGAFLPRDASTPNGFRVTGNSSSNGKVRLNNVITENGWWTVSFDIKGSQSVAVGMTMTIADNSPTKRVVTNASNTYSRVFISAEVKNFSSVYNFVDWSSIGWNYFWIDNIKVEKGNKASDWSEAPQDTATQTQITQLTTDINLRATTAGLMAQINVNPEGVLLQGKNILLDGNVTMLQAFVNRLDVYTLSAVYADIATLKTRVLTADVITSTHLKVDNAMMDKLTANTAVVNYLFTKTAFVDNLNAKTLTAITANITSIRSQVLIANVVQATHLQADAATITKLFATDANVNLLTAKTAFISSVKAIDIAADRITTGTLNASLVNIIYLNANSITTGTLNGANYSNNLNTGVETFRNPSSGDVLILTQGAIQFQNGAQTRFLNYNAEGLIISGGSGNTGTSRNASLHLNGGVSYVQFNNFAGTVNQGRIQMTSDSAKIMIPSAELNIQDNNGVQAAITANYFKTEHNTGETLWMQQNRIYTVRSGNRNIFLEPNGTGSVVAGNGGGTRWNMVASDFVKQSSRDTKTNIVPLESGLDNIRQLKAVSYNKIDKLNQGIFEIEKGFIAEDSLMVATVDGKGIYDSHITAYLVKAVQELDQKVVSIDSLATAANAIANNAMNKALQVDSEVQQMKNKISELEKEIKTLKGAA